jgi:hypothetical protein
MALFDEHMLKCVRNLLDTADIVGDAILREQTTSSSLLEYLCRISLGLDPFLSKLLQAVITGREAR